MHRRKGSMVIIATVLLVLFLLVLSAAAQARTVSVSGVSLSRGQVTLPRGQDVTISAYVQPDDASDKLVYWVVSDSSIAEIDPQGSRVRVRGLAEGETWVTAVTRDGDYRSSCRINVVVNLDDIGMKEKNIEIAIGEKVSLDYTMTPDDPTDDTVRWYSSDYRIVSVDQEGQIEGLAPGRAQIWVLWVPDELVADFSNVTVTGEPLPPASAGESDQQEGDAETAGPADSDPADSADPEETEGGDQSEQADESLPAADTPVAGLFSGEGQMVYLIGAAIALVILIVVILLISRRKKSKPSAKAAAFSATSAHGPAVAGPVSGPHTVSRPLTGDSSPAVTRSFAPGEAPRTVAVKRKTPSLIGVSGSYAGQMIDLSQGAVTIGKDPDLAQLIYGPSTADISRKHCTVSYEGAEGAFMLVDYSAAGTFLVDGGKLDREREYLVKAGTEFYLGSPGETFRLDMTESS